MLHLNKNVQTQSLPKQGKPPNVATRVKGDKTSGIRKSEKYSTLVVGIEIMNTNLTYSQTIRKKHQKRRGNKGKDLMKPLDLKYKQKSEQEAFRERRHLNVCVL